MPRKSKKSGLLKALGFSIPLIVAPLAKGQDSSQVVQPDTTQLQMGAYFTSDKDLYYEFKDVGGDTAWYQIDTNTGEVIKRPILQADKTKFWREGDALTKQIDLEAKVELDITPKPKISSVVPEDAVVTEQDTTKTHEYTLYHISPLEQEDIQVRLLDVRKDLSDIRNYLEPDGTIIQDSLQSFFENNPTDSISQELLTQALEKRSLDEVRADLKKGKLLKIKDGIYVVDLPRTDELGLIRVDREEKRPVAIDPRLYFTEGALERAVEKVVEPAREKLGPTGFMANVGLGRVYEFDGKSIDYKNPIMFSGHLGVGYNGNLINFRYGKGSKSESSSLEDIGGVDPFSGGHSHSYDFINTDINSERLGLGLSKVTNHFIFSAGWVRSIENAINTHNVRNEFHNANHEISEFGDSYQKVDKTSNVRDGLYLGIGVGVKGAYLQLGADFFKHPRVPIGSDVHLDLSYTFGKGKR